MTWQLTPYTVPLVLATLVAAVAAFFVWRDGDSRAETWGVTVQLGIATWALLHLVIVTTTALGLKQLLLGLIVPTTTFLAVAVFGFVLCYTGRGDRLTRRRVGLLVGFPMAVLLLSLTNRFHELVFVNPRLDSGSAFVTVSYGWGPGFVVSATISYAIMGVSLVLLYRKFRHSRNVYRKISFVLFASTLVLGSATLASTLKLSPVPHFMLLPVLYLFFGVVLVLVTTSVRFLRLLPVDRLLAIYHGESGALVPLARDVIMEEVDNGIVTLDTEFRVVDINTTGKKMLRSDRPVGRRVPDIVDADMLPPESELSRIVRGEAELRELREQVWVAAPGGDRCYDLTISELRGRDGELTGFVALMHDITQQKRDEEQLRERERQLEHRTAQLEREKAKLEHQNDRLDEFASVISHDLRNPLNVADGHMQLIEAELENGEESVAVDAETIETVRGAHDRMEKLVEDTLTLARQGKVITETEPLPLGPTARAAWANLETGDAALVAETDAVVDGDRARLLTLLENLFRNAIEHGLSDPDTATRQDATEHGGDGLTVRVQRHGDDEFVVADDGTGIPDDRKADVLDRGYSTNPGGTGLGLAIVRDVAGAHGWDVAIEDSAEGGTAVVISGVDLSEPMPGDDPEQESTELT